MKNIKSRKDGFSLIELIIVVVLIGVLSVVSFVAIQRARTRAMNEKMLDDLMAIYTALEDYQRDHQGEYPIPDPDSNQNILCYFADATYAHDCDHPSVAFRQGMIDNNLLTKRYLREVPTDPRTGSRYVYGVTNDGRYFQVAGNYEREDGTYEARTAENIVRGFHLPSLIRSFDGADFVLDKQTYLPYSPDHLALTARLENVDGTVEVNDDPAVHGQILRQDDRVVTADGTADIYFSDGSVTHLDVNSELELKHMKVDKNDADGTFTKILLRLKAGKIWSKVVRLASESEFRVETNAAIAGVRGTEFGVDADGTVKVKSGEVWKEGKPVGMGDDASAEEVMDIPEPDETYNAPAAAPEEYEDFYQTIHLNTGIQPHILSVEEGGKLTVRNVNHFVDEVDNVVGLNRSIQVTHLAAYDADNRDTETGEPLFLAKIGITPGSNGDPHVFQSAEHFYGHSVILRFEDRDPDTDTILHRSGFSQPPIQISAETELNESQIYEQDIVEEIPVLTLMHSPFVPVGDTDLLELSTEPVVEGVSYVVTVAEESGSICSASEGPDSNPDDNITEYTVNTYAMGDCVLNISATMPDGTTEIPGETVTIEVIEASANLLLISPYEGEEMFTMGDTMPVNFVWDAPNAPADVMFTVNIDNTDHVLGHDFSFEQILGTGPHTWHVSMVDGMGTVLETSDLRHFTITSVQAGGADFTIKDSDENTVSDNLVVYTDSVTLNLAVAASDANYTYQWSGSLPMTNTEGASNSAYIYGLTPNSPQPYSVILTVLNAEGAQADQSSKQLTVVYEPKPTIDAITFSPSFPTSLDEGTSFEIAIILDSNADVLIDASSDPGAVGQSIKGDCKWYLDATEVTDPVNTVFSPEGNYTVECKLLTAGFSNPDYLLPADVTTGEVVVNVVPGAVCGNDIVEMGEVCDPPSTTTTESSCISEGFPYGGDLYCNADCTAFDTTNCDTLETVCVGNGGHWDGTDCWMLGAAGQACGQYEDPQNPGNFLPGACEDAGLSCVVGDWNDDVDLNASGKKCDICQTLVGINEADLNCAYSEVAYAPYNISTLCRYRMNVSQDCTSSDPSWSRICKCQ